MGRTRVTGKVEPIVKKWLSKDEAKSYIGCSDDFLRTLREKALISFSQFGKMIWYDLSNTMLTLKQSPAAIILMLSACSLAEGEPEPGKLIIALLIVFITVIYVLVCNYLNVKRHGGESSMYR